MASLPPKVLLENILLPRGFIGGKDKDEVYVCDWRQFRFDFYHPELKIAIEYDGLAWRRRGESDAEYARRISRHTNPVGFANDCDKRNLAQLLGIIVLNVTAGHITKSPGRFLDLIEFTIKIRKQKIENPEIELAGIFDRPFVPSGPAASSRPRKPRRYKRRAATDRPSG